MNKISVAAASLNQTPLDWQGNKLRIVEAIEKAREVGVQILCLPELCITGYGCEDAFLSQGVQRTALQLLAEILIHTKKIVVNVGLPINHEGKLYNTTCLIADGAIQGFVAKQNLANDGIHYEPRWFTPWTAGNQATTTIDHNTYPLGDLLFEIDDWKIGFEICEDAWVENRPAERLCSQGIDLILNPSASHFAFGKTEIRRQLVLDVTSKYQVAYILCNLIGNEAGRAIYDGDCIIALGERVIASSQRFTYHDVELTFAELELDQIRESRDWQSFITESDVQTACIKIDSSFSTSINSLQTEHHQSEQRDKWESGPYVKEEEFTRAISLALFDYLRKSHSDGFVVSLSGGADSAAVATLVGLMVRAGIKSLGLQGFKQKLSAIKTIDDCNDARSLTEKLLTCVYQSTKNSSETTLAAARDVAQGLGATFYQFDVDQLVTDYVKIVGKAIGRKLNWQQDDIALQNIQARTRAPGVWLLANLRNGLLLATSNRSEAAVGYTTMDGDTCGGLSPIAGIDKAFLRSWLSWMETHGTAEFGPLEFLSSVNIQEPTAELRPAEKYQTDESDLMPYDLLDAIERAAIRDKLLPLEVFEQVRDDFSQYSISQLGSWVVRFFQLWCRNQWKRERFAPSFHVDDENLDPKTWCRFPILNGGYERELKQLEEKIQSLCEND